MPLPDQNQPSKAKPERLGCNALVRRDLDLLLELAASLLMPGNLPSVFLEDWELPKSTPLAVRRKIHDEACKAKAFVGDVAAKLAGIHDRLSANDQRQATASTNP